MLIPWEAVSIVGLVMFVAVEHWNHTSRYKLDLRMNFFLLLITNENDPYF